MCSLWGSSMVPNSPLAVILTLTIPWGSPYPFCFLLLPSQCLIWKVLMASSFSSFMDICFFPQPSNKALAFSIYFSVWPLEISNWYSLIDKTVQLVFISLLLLDASVTDQLQSLPKCSPASMWTQVIIDLCSLPNSIQSRWYPCFHKSSSKVSPSNPWPLFSLVVNAGICVWVHTYMFLNITCSVCIMLLACMLLELTIWPCTTDGCALL